jgi:hypothetical protein
MPLSDFGLIGREHLLRPAPRPVPLDDAGDGDVADLEFMHAVRALVFMMVSPG